MIIDPDKLAQLRRRISTLSDAQRERLREQLEAQGIDWESLGSEPHSALPMADHAKPERIPLTPSQSHVWLLHQLYPELCAYHIPFSWHFSGQLQVESLQQAIDEVVSKHSALRTNFVQDEHGIPWQQVREIQREAQAVQLAKVEIEGPASSPQAAHELTTRPFDLAREPLFRVQLQRVDSDHHILIFVLHHLIADGWSRGVLLRDLAESYNLALRGSLVNCETATRLQQTEYSVFLADQKWRESGEHDRHLEYWQRKLAGLTKLALPTDHPRPKTATFASGLVTKSLRPELSNKLQQVSQQLGATLFMTLLTAFKVFVHRYTRERDIAIGVPVGGRRHAECADLVGFFVNTIVLRTLFSDPVDDTFATWLQAVKATVIEGLEHQAVPFSSVVEACAPNRSSHANPLFEIMFQLQSDGYRSQNASAPDVEFSGLHLTQEHLQLPETKFDLTWHVFDREDGLLMAVEYRTALFSEARISRMLDHFQQLLEQIVIDPKRRIGDYSLLALAERDDLLEMGSATVLPDEEPEPKPLTFIETFSRQVAKSPNAPAVRFESQSLTYVELDQRAADLAEKLQAVGVGVNSVVGIHLPRSIDLMVAVIGVMKSGGAYLPLDPQLPTARKEYMQQNAHCSIVVDAGGIKVSTSTVEIAGEQLDTNMADAAAYVMYTSGSTGQPKGAVISHAGLMNYLQWCTQTYPFTTGWGAPVQSSFGFDATITSMLAPLVVGKLVHLLPKDSELQALADILQTGPSVLKLTPAHLAALQPLISINLKPKLLPQALVVGGETLTAEHVRFWQKNYPTIEIYNEYGPTETVVGCCVHKIDEQTNQYGNLPIGRPISGTQLYVLDEYLEPMPMGCPGELYISGAGVAHGYLGRPALTAERFVPNPFATPDGKHGRVMYRTGDLACFQTSGVLHYLGRTDHQVQLNGYRIELGEIEALLRKQTGVRECAVVCFDGASSAASFHQRKQLVAFVETDASVLQPGQLLDALKQELPDYMLPKQFEFLPQLPLTQNGKIDREALSVTRLTSASSEPVAPRNDREIQLLEIWRNVLNVAQLGVEDNFFERGGDSIIAMQIIAGARREGLKLTPAQLFEHQTIAAQAAVAEVMSDFAAGPQQPPTGEVRLGPMQQAFFDLGQPDLHHFNQGLLLRSHPQLDFQLLTQAIHAVHSQHDAFRLRFEQTDAGEWRQWYDDQLEQTPTVEDLDLTQAGNFQQALEETIRQRQTSFDLKQGPLFHAARFRGPQGEDRLLLLAHHLVVDGISWRILLGDLDDAYRQLTEQKEIVFPERTSSFGQWTEQIANSYLPNLSWNQSHQITNTWQEAETLEVSMVAPAKLDEAVLITALAQTLSQFYRRSKTLVDIERHGRDAGDNTLDLSRTVGWFTTIRTLSLALPAGPAQSQLQYVRGLLQSSLTHSPHAGPEHAEISFNYLGNLSMPASELISGLAPESIPDLSSPRNVRRYLTDVVAWQQEGRLQILWRYHRTMNDRETTSRLAERCLAAIESLLAQTNAETSRPQPTNERGLDKLMTKLQTRGT